VEGILAGARRDDLEKLAERQPTADGEGPSVVPAARCQPIGRPEGSAEGAAAGSPARRERESRFLAISSGFRHDSAGPVRQPAG